MNILLTGSDGQVGRALTPLLADLGSLTACNRSRLDLANPDRIVEAVRGARPNLIVNAAAYTAVDMAESNEQAAHAVNSRAPAILAEEAKRLGSMLVHFSTDYVFDGKKAAPYTEDDPPNPLGAYGRTKLEGDRAVIALGGRHLIFRTCWVYSPYGRNFLLTMLRLARERPELRVVDDQVGSPTTSEAIARACAHVLSEWPDALGIFNLSMAGRTSWCGFARAIIGKAGLATPVVPIPTSAYPTPATRPLNSLLDNSRFERQFGFSLPNWEEGLDRTFSELRGGTHQARR